jgi:exopolyphosphatase / guanosine-5'-triphosphate,3'-diphosphate pyrophosphatase
VRSRPDTLEGRTPVAMRDEGEAESRGCGGGGFLLAVEAMPSSVAVIDIGSNTIKVLVATRTVGGALQALAMKTVDARISAGISRAEPRLSEQAMQRGLEAVETLLAFAAEHQPEQVIAVATSAVRDARNGADFCRLVQSATGCEIRLLGGEEEANLIGRGLTADPALAHLQDFYLFDLGGGSLECLSFRGRRMQQARSFQLGCVRLTERFVPQVENPLSTDVALALGRHVRTELTAGSFAFDLSPAAAVFAGGSMTATRAILAAEVGQTLETSSPRVTVDELREVLARVAELPLSERKLVPGLPAARADVYPTAVVTMLAVAEVAGANAFQHSFYNLRWGVAAEALPAM